MLTKVLSIFIVISITIATLPLEVRADTAGVEYNKFQAISPSRAIAKYLEDRAVAQDGTEDVDEEPTIWDKIKDFLIIEEAPFAGLTVGYLATLGGLMCLTFTAFPGPHQPFTGIAGLVLIAVGTPTAVLNSDYRYYLNQGKPRKPNSIITAVPYPVVMVIPNASYEEELEQYFKEIREIIAEVDPEMRERAEAELIEEKGYFSEEELFEKIWEIQQEARRMK